MFYNSFIYICLSLSPLYTQITHNVSIRPQLGAVGVWFYCVWSCGSRYCFLASLVQVQFEILNCCWAICFAHFQSLVALPCLSIHISTSRDSIIFLQPWLTNLWLLLSSSCLHACAVGNISKSFRRSESYAGIAAEFWSWIAKSTTHILSKLNVKVNSGTRGVYSLPVAGTRCVWAMLKRVPDQKLQVISQK